MIKDPVTGDYHLDANIFVQLGAMFENGEVKEMITPEAVSYTHLDVYKRQLSMRRMQRRPGRCRL